MHDGNGVYRCNVVELVDYLCTSPSRYLYLVVTLSEKKGEDEVHFFFETALLVGASRSFVPFYLLL